MTFTKLFAQPIALGTGMLVAMSIDASAIDVSDITVRSSSAAIADNAATEFWPNLENDIKQALVKELADVASVEGATIQVNVRELSVVTSPDKEMDDAVLRTSLLVFEDGEPKESIQHTVTVNQEREGGFDGDRILIPRTSDEFYANLVQYYAATAAEKVREIE